MVSLTGGGAVAVRVHAADNSESAGNISQEIRPNGRNRITGRILFGKYERAEMFGHVIRIPLTPCAGLLPAQEVPLWIGALSFDPVQVHSPVRTRFYRRTAHRSQRYFGRRIPDMGGLIDARRCLPAGTPGVIVLLFI